MQEGFDLHAQDLLVRFLGQFASVVEIADDVPQQFKRNVSCDFLILTHFGKHFYRDLEVVRRKVVRLRPAKGAKFFSLVNDCVHDCHREEHALELAAIIGHLRNIRRCKQINRLDTVRSDVVRQLE